MKNEKWKQIIEGPIMVVLGIICLILSAQIRRNPVKVQGFLNVIVQTKMLPCLISVFIIGLGIVLTVQLSRGQLTTAVMSGETWLRVLVLAAITLAYLLVVYRAGFLIPTFLYCFSMLLFLNWKQKNAVFLLVLSVVYTAVAVYLVPGILNLNLML